MAKRNNKAPRQTAPKTKSTTSHGSGTRLEEYYPFLASVALKPFPVVLAGHAANYWLRMLGDEELQGKLKNGKDLDLLVAPQHAAAMQKQYPCEPSTFFPQDILFFPVRRFIFRQEITPFVPDYILRAGALKVGRAGKRVLEVDMMLHPPGWSPKSTRKWAISIENPEGENPIYLANPIQLLYIYIVTSHTLGQTRTRRERTINRKDAQRALLLFQIIPAFIEKYPKVRGKDNLRLWKKIQSKDHFKQFIAEHQLSLPEL